MGRSGMGVLYDERVGLEGRGDYHPDAAPTPSENPGCRSGAPRRVPKKCQSPVPAPGGARGLALKSWSEGKRSYSRDPSFRGTNPRARIGPGVRIGRDVEIGPGVTLVESDIADGVDIGERSTLRGVACGDHTIIGPGARLTDVFLGSTVDVRSTLDDPVVLEDYCALGDEVRVRAGTRLSGVHAFPRLDIRGTLPHGASLSGVSDLLRLM